MSTHNGEIRREGHWLLMGPLDSCSVVQGGVLRFCTMLISVTEAAPLCALSFSHVLSDNQGISHNYCGHDSLANAGSHVFFFFFLGLLFLTVGQVGSFVAKERGDKAA